MTNSPTEPELLKALTDAGWLLEQSVSHVLADADCNPRLSWAFRDADDPTKSREVDVFGYRQLLRLEIEQILVSATFLVECKQSATPYVAIGQKLPSWQFKHPTQHKIPTEELRFTTEDSGHFLLQPAWNVLGFAEISKEFGEERFRATQLTRLDRVKGGNWSASNSGIFTSLIFPLAKAVRSTQEDYVTANTAGNGGVVKRNRWLSFDLTFPVVVTSSELIVVDTSTREPIVSRPGWTTARRHLETDTVRGQFDFDIVRELSFADYVANRIKFAEALAELVRSDPFRYTGEAWEPPTIDG